MSKIVTLKKKAAELERKSPDKAIPVYVELASEMERHPEDMDVAILNRLGDLLVKQHNIAEAANYYEKAVDYYADGGFVNNAIALCNKILRVSPGRSTVYYKLGRISAQKGFKADAKQNFLEYADRMQKAGRLDEAFRALQEFADLCPDQTDIRSMLADQLVKAGKKAEAIEQLQILHEQLDAEGATDETEATANRLRALDPDVVPRTGGGGGKSSDKSSDLVFIDLSDSPAAQSARRSFAKRHTQGLKLIPMDDEKPAPRKSEPARPAPTPTARKSEPARPAPSATPTPPAAAASPPPRPAEPPTAPTPQKPRESIVEPEPVIESTSIPGLQTTSLTASDVNSALGGGIELQPTSLIDEPIRQDLTSDPGMLDFIMPSGSETLSEGRVGLPLMDDTLIMPDAADTLSPEAAAISEIPLLDASLEEIEAVSVTPLPEAARPSTLMAVKSVEMLQAVVEGDPEDWASRRELAEALLEAGDREAGVHELEIAMAGFERSGDLTTAMSVADEIVRLDPSSVKHHQKRVEYAYRTNDRPLLVESYLALADSLFRSGQADKARTIYQRVLELSPDDIRAQAALSTIPETPPEPPVADRKSGAAVPRKTTPVVPKKPERKATPTASDAFVNLGDWLREDEGAKNTRMVVAEEEPTGNEEADFADMLRKFKAGVAENVEDEDYQSHYDLGVAFKEMGLVDEAIAEFQKALRSPHSRVRTYEAIGQCFIEKGQDQMAATILARALGEGEQGDDHLVGVLYLLGRAHEALGHTDEALQYYQRVFVVDIQFHDVADRLNALENAAR